MQILASMGLSKGVWMGGQVASPLFSRMGLRKSLKYWPEDEPMSPKL